MDLLEKIYKASTSFLEQQTLEETYATIVREAIKLFDANYGSLVLEKNNELSEVYSTLPFIVKRRKRGTTYQAFRKGEISIIHPNKTKSFKKAHPQFNKLQMSSIVDIPLFNKKTPIGVLILNSLDKENYSKKEKDALLLYGSLASLAIRKTQLYEETKKALETRDLFISMASHELKTPLTAVNGYVQLLYSKIANQMSTESRWIEQLSWEMRRLTDLVKELLEMDRIRTGQLHYDWKECSLKEILKRSINNFKFSHSHRELIFEDLSLDRHDLVIGDYDKILQVISNLLDNAVKFSPATTPIKLMLKTKNNDLVIYVQDQGIGINKKDRMKLFEKFFQADNHKVEGMGLGLFLVKDIIDRHLGSIKVHSAQNKGTTFEVTFPKAKL